ncbi:MAG: cytochrome c, partial [Pricia sp.]|nr:cytochrome c [Pricia sp.]
DVNVGQDPEGGTKTDLEGASKKLFVSGEEIYNREGFCVTCHQPDGLGLSASQFPPLAKSPWVTGNEERLIKLTLHGLMGPLELMGKSYPGQVPMTPYGGMLNDEEIASVLTFVRNAFGNKAPAIDPELVKKVREETKDKKGFYSPAELLKEHPIQ